MYVNMYFDTTTNRFVEKKVCFILIFSVCIVFLSLLIKGKNLLEVFRMIWLSFLIKESMKLIRSLLCKSVRFLIPKFRWKYIMNSQPKLDMTRWVESQHHLSWTFLQQAWMLTNHQKIHKNQVKIVQWINKKVKNLRKIQLQRAKTLKKINNKPNQTMIYLINLI